MTPLQFKFLRKRAGLSVAEWGRVLGYDGANVGVQIRQMETGAKPIRPWIARLAVMFDRCGIPDDFHTHELEIPEAPEELPPDRRRRRAAQG